MQEAKTIQVNMSISGEFLTAHSRLMVLSNDWRGALDLLTDGLLCDDEGIDANALALSILKGEKCLVGDSNSEDGITLKDQDQNCPELARYLQTVKFQNAGLFRFKSKVYRPYARIEALDDNDYCAAREKTHHSKMTQPDFVIERAMYYAPTRDHIVTLPATKQIDVRTMDLRDEEEDFAQFLMIWEPWADYPLWLKPTTDAKTAIENFAKDRGFRYSNTTGADTYYLDMKKKDIEEYEEFLLDRESQLTESQEDERNALLDRRHRNYLSECKAKIESRLGPRGGSDWLRVPVFNDEEKIHVEGALPDFYVEVPKLPFQHWALENIPAVELGALQPWEPVTYSGMKQQNDSVYHNDWVVGAGIDPDVYGREHILLDKSAQHQRFKIASELAKFEIVPLCKSTKGYFSGKVRWVAPGEELKKGEVGVIPHAGVEYDAALRSAAKHKTGIICKVGGPLAHMVVVGREMDVPVAMWDKADLLKSYHNVFVSLSNGTISFN
ncbi:hypothetical protein YA0089_19035 [Pseudomonas viridiflava]|uniref:hypothetical protein n=1 Tax=Pseudomonas viridiflava TaxID=33069 RepID=UPI0018E65B05|nr:hypothetical protein [Pseudomonas viridiflava]MBI6725703.1 hypothetical protein [Pseudomonas viridiflava]